MPTLEFGKPAPEFSLPDIEGAQVCLQDFHGRLLLVNFWSSECPWVERADEMLREWMATWGEAVAWVSVACNANEPLEEIRRAAQARHVPQVLLDPQQQVADAFGALTTPHIFVIDAQGVVRFNGAIDDTTFRQRTPTRHYAFEAVQALLNGEAPPVPEAAPYGCSIVRFRMD